MRFLLAGRPSVLAATLATLGLGACTGPRPFLLQGDANSVEVGYSGDVDSTLPIARRHCARFERVPRLVEAGIDVAYFNCIRG